MCHATPRLPVLVARLQIRESTLGPLRPERSFRCPAFALTVGLAMCSNKMLARLPQLMNVRQIAMVWVSRDVRYAKTINHRVTDPTKRSIVLNCLFLILSQTSFEFLSQSTLRVHRAAGDGQVHAVIRSHHAQLALALAAVKFCSRQLAPRSTSRPGSSHT